MAVTLNLAREQKQSANVDLLAVYLQQLLGQPFQFLRFSYGDELTLHLGTLREPRGRSKSSKPKGSYIIGARASAWFLNAPGQALIYSSATGKAKKAQPLALISKEDIESSHLVRPGERIVAAVPYLIRSARKPLGIGLTLVLSDGFSVSILPSMTSRAKSGRVAVADWEVFTPHNRYLRVGPGARWSYLDSTKSSDAPAA